MKKYLENLRIKELSHNGKNSISNFDFLSECLLLRDKDYTNLVDYVKNNTNSIECDFLNQMHFECKYKIEQIDNKFKNLALSPEQCRSLWKWHKRDRNYLRKQLSINNIDNYISMYNKEAFQSFYSIGMDSIYLKLIYAKALSYEYLSENAIYHRICDVLLNKYKKDYERENFDYKTLMTSEVIKSELKDIYGENPLCKYDLFKIDLETHHIVNQEMSYILDSDNYGNYLVIDGSKKRIIEIFKDLIDKNYIKDISFKIECITDRVVALEDLKYGQKFSLNLADLPNVSVFYDMQNPEDNIWVNVREEKNKKYSITFEETLDDTFYDKDLNVITNLVHLEVTRNNDLDVISHIDHEYIIYDVDTYMERLKDSSIKGEHKVKTFKIDNAAIPLNYRYGNSNVLFIIINECMNNKNLVKEYFQKLM